MPTISTEHLNYSSEWYSLWSYSVHFERKLWSTNFWLPVKEECRCKFFKWSMKKVASNISNWCPSLVLATNTFINILKKSIYLHGDCHSHGWIDIFHAFPELWLLTFAFGVRDYRKLRVHQRLMRLMRLSFVLRFNFVSQIESHTCTVRFIHVASCLDLMKSCQWRTNRKIKWT